MTDIECTRDGAIATVTINRPDVRNAMKLAMWQDVAATFRRLSGDKSVRAIILTGSGGNFSVGADISEFDAVRSDAASSKTYEVAVDASSDAIAEAPQPVIAVLSGYCLGGGCHLSMACDFRFAGPSAEIGIPAANLSIVYGVRSTKRLLSLVGLTNAKRILYTAERLNARSALHIGLVDRVSDDPAGDARSLAAQISEKAPLSIAGAKHILNAAALMEPDAKADRIIDHASASQDYSEARRAFAEKRQPKFTWS